MPPRTRKEPAPAAQAPADDVAMTDAPAAAAPTTEEDEVYFNDTQRIRILPGSTETAASFEFEGEDHTLGNALRYIIMKNPDVEFCGYSIPHPSEPKMNIRIQTYEGTAYDALEKGFNDLMDLCDVVADKFSTSRQDFVENVAE